MRRIIEVYTYYIYTVYILFYFSPSFLLEDTFVSKPSCSALQTTEPRKTSVAFHRWINWSRTDGMDVWKPIFASENLIRAVHHFFHAKKHVKRGCKCNLRISGFFFGQFWRFESWPCRKSNGNPCRAILWLVDWTTPKFNQVLWVTTNGIFAATQKESHCYSFRTLVNKDPLLILKVSIIKAFVSRLGPNLTSTHHLRCQH